MSSIARNHALGAMHRVLNDNGIEGVIHGYARGPRFLSFQLRLSNPMQLKRALNLGDNIALEVGSPAVVVQRRLGNLEYQFQLGESYWEDVRMQDMDGMQIGLAANNSPIVFGFDEYHHLFAGATKSGKSTAMMATIVALARTYEPGQLALYICDPHHDYEDLDRLAHLAAPVAHTREEIKQTIVNVYNLYHQRKEDNERNPATKVVLVIDEMQEDICLGSKDVGLNTDTLDMVSNMVRGGGKFGIHIIGGSQKPTEANLPGLLDNMLGRYVGKVNKAHNSAHLTGQPGLRAELLTGRGDFLQRASDEVTRFQVARVQPADIQALPMATPPALEVAHAIDTSVVTVSERPAGRPHTELDPGVVAYYLVSEKVSIGDAKKQGIGRHLHNRYKNYAGAIVKAMEELHGEG